MSFELTGVLLLKYDTQNVNDKFKKREFVVETTEQINGNIYPNYAKMQLVQAKCDIIDRFNLGDTVKVTFNVKGNAYVDKKDGLTKYMTNLDAWRIEYPQGQQTQHAPQAPPQQYSVNQPDASDDLPF